MNPTPQTNRLSPQPTPPLVPVPAIDPVHAIDTSTLEAAAQADADFFVPDEFCLPRELESPVPREMPERFAGCHSTRQIRKAAIAGMIAGVVLSALTLVPGIGLVAQTFPPLRFLHIIAPCVTACSIAGLVYSLIHRGDAIYLKDGVAVPARITSISRNPSLYHNGMVSRRAFDVVVEIAKYDTGPPVARTIREHDMASEKALKKELTLSPGQWTTVVYLKSDFEKSIRLYECMDFQPDRGLRDADGTTKSFWSNLFGGLAIGCLILLPLWSLWAFDRYTPIGGMGSSGYVVLGSIGLALGAAMAFCLMRGSNQDRTTEHQTVDEHGQIHVVKTDDAQMGIGIKILVVIGCFMMPLIFGSAVVQAVNTWLDNSAARPEPAIVTSAESQIHKGMYQTYRLRISLPDRGIKRHSIIVDAETFGRVTRSAAQQGIALDPWGKNAGLECKVAVNEGAFGWPWISNVTAADPN